MSFPTLYSYNPSPSILRTVKRSTEDPNYVTYSDFFIGGGGSTPQPPVGTIVSIICAPDTFDQYTYRVQAGPPYAYATKQANSIYCGYVKPTCDIAKVNFTTTDETDSGANDGTANLFCTSSFAPITYTLRVVLGPDLASNTTGYFTGLAPANNYRIDAVDTNACAFSQDFVILPFDSTKTHFKYRLKFNSRDGLTPFELQLYDMRHSYDATLFPKDITGTGIPVSYKQSDPNEDKTTAIVSANLTINLIYTGLDFTPAEFSNVPEQSWYIVLEMGGLLYFQGWLLPDELQDFYADPEYPVTLTATDGIPSLKGNIFGDGSGGQGYGTAQIQQYGLVAWKRLVKQCLDQLGYNYNVKVVSSLRYNGTYDRDLWLNMGTWADILYDSSGTPMDTYSALELLLKSMRLCLINHLGEFVLVNWNDMFYLTNGVVSDEFEKAFYQFADDMSNINTTGLDVTQPLLQPIGFGFPIAPVNPMQTINYDKAYNIEGDVSFDILALLFENPSFEIGPIQGELPPDWVANSPNNAFFNYDPPNPADVQLGAYDGDWELRIQGYSNFTTATYDLGIFLNLFRNGDMDSNSSIYFVPGFVCDQVNQKFNVSFAWRPQYYDATYSPQPVIGIEFVQDGTGDKYFWNVDQNKWIIFPHYDFYPAFVTNFGKITDYRIWLNFNTSTDAMPGTGIVYLKFYGAVPVAGARSWGTQNHTIKTYDIDALNLTFSDASQSSALQTAEIHTMTAVTGLPQANLKQTDLRLFTYPNNKRVAGNIFYGHDYSTAPVSNLWNFALKSVDPKDRLAATVTRSIARNYGFHMLKFEGDVQCSSLQYYGLFTLQYYDGVLFMPYSIEGDLRNSVWHVVLIQCSDNDVQDVYKYTPKYERNARQNG